MPGRKYNSDKYRYGFNGKEKDQEGEFGSITNYDYGFRIYNPAIGKFLSVDPLMSDYPELTPYQYASNTPIWAVDLDGLEALVEHDYRKIIQDNFPLIKNGDEFTIRIKTEFIAGGTDPKPKYEIYPGLINPSKGGAIQEVKVNGKSVKVLDQYSQFSVAWFRRNADKWNASFNIEAASLFGPSLLGKIFKGGKYSKNFLDDLTKIIPGSGVRKFVVRAPKTGFKNSKVKQDFASAFKSVKNNINNHLGDGDISGIIKDLHGKPSGGQHKKEVLGALAGLKNSVKTIRHQINNGQLKGEALDAGIEAVNAAQQAIKRVTDVLSSASRSVKNHVKDGTL